MATFKDRKPFDNADIKIINFPPDSFFWLTDEELKMYCTVEHFCYYELNERKNRL